LFSYGVTEVLPEVKPLKRHLCIRPALNHQAFFCGISKMVTIEIDEKHTFFKKMNG